jgi:hypothetical protein
MILFNDFEYESKKDLKEFLQEIDNQNAIVLIEMALSYASKQGSFDIDESHCIFMCLSKLKNNLLEKTDE